MVRELQLESGITTVFVTHDQEEALALSDVVAVMDRGRVVQAGAPTQIYARPTTGYAADFLGSANLIAIEGELPSENPGLRRFKVAGGIVAIAAARGEVDAKKAQIALRREEIEVAPAVATEGDEGDNRLRGRVEGVEFRGSITGYRVRAAAGLIHVDVWSVQHGRVLERGEEVVLRIPSSALLVEAAR
jgi:iron(III) transport system ATP-binding protein